VGGGGYQPANRKSTLVSECKSELQIQNLIEKDDTPEEINLLIYQYNMTLGLCPKGQDQLKELREWSSPP
jgi:hypothetical protein